MAFKPRPINVNGNDNNDAVTVKSQEATGAKIRAFVATPAYDGRVLTDYAISIAESCHIAPLFGIHVQASVMGNGAFIDIARNIFVKMFLDSDATHLFYIDADLRWEARAFVSLLQSGLPICAGVYPKRQTPEEYPVGMAPHPKTGGVWVTDGEGNDAETGWIQCERVPTGFLCIRRDVVEMMVANSPMQALGKQPPHPMLFLATPFVRDENNRHRNVDMIDGTFKPTDAVDFIGEDFYFCDRYRRLTGKTIPAWPDFDFTHGKDWTGNWHQFLNRQSIIETEKKASVDLSEMSRAA